MDKLTRRTMFAQSSKLLSSFALGTSVLKAEGELSTKPHLKVVVAGAHPDDPESGCGGTIARYTSAGHDVVLLYLTRGEAGIKGSSAVESAKIRTAESVKACEILGARALFAGQVDGSTQVDHDRYDQFYRMLEAEKPNIVFTHWPIDSHRDHRAASLMVYDYWLKSSKSANLFYYEVETGSQTQLFHPTHYVNITETEERKRSACFAHSSQHPETGFYPMHDRMQRCRGMEHGCPFAEAFIRHSQNPSSDLPGLSL